MFEIDVSRRAASSSALLVQIDFGEAGQAERLAEFSQLVESAGAKIVGTVRAKRAAPDAKLFAGSGKVEEIAAMVRELDAGLVIFNHALSPGQQRNLERALEARVVDRTTLILDIFAQRAQSHEGKLQVELAQLEHLSTRLVRGWTHLERQKGGIGLRGPGETQLETDRRLLGKRVKLLKERLAILSRQRSVRRRSRERRPMMSVSLVGYTNAGKSTLFNTLTHERVYAADQLFATLDTTSRRLYLGEAGSIVISDTVGFIRDLPHQLVEAFKATLEETAGADLLLHVVDSASPDREQQIEAVNQVLGEIGAGDVPQILIWNKIDETHAQCGVEYDAYGKLRRVLLSAKTGEGIGALRAALGEIAKSFNARVQSAASSSACEPIAPSLEPGAHTHFQQD